MASRIRVPHRIQHELERAESLVDRRRVGQMIDRNFDELRAGGGGGGPQVIDVGDSVVYTGYTKPYYPLAAGTLVRVYATLTAVGLTNTTANIYQNADLLGVVDIAPGELISAPLEVNAAFAETDFWQALVTQSGTDAAGLTIYGVFA